MNTVEPHLAQVAVAVPDKVLSVPEPLDNAAVVEVAAEEMLAAGAEWLMSALCASWSRAGVDSGCKMSCRLQGPRSSLGSGIEGTER